MRQAANLKDLEVPGAAARIRINTSPTDFYPIEQVQLDALRRQDLGAVRRVDEPLTRDSRKALAAGRLSLS